MSEEIKIINKFYGGQIRDDKANVIGAVSNIEELDIFSNKNYIQPEQIMSADTLPTGMEIYAYTSDDDDNIYAYGKETTGGKVMLAKLSNGGSDNPGTFVSLFTSSDATNLAVINSPLQYHKTSESNPDYLYYIAGAGSTWYLKRYDITGGTESLVGQLTGLTGSYDRPTMKRFYGELYVIHGQYIAKVDDDGVFTEKAWTLPNSQKAIDIIPVSDVALVIAQNTNRFVNESVGYWWDLESSTQFDDRFTIPMGGAQWIYNWKEKIIIFCAQNGIGKFYQLSGAYPGALPLEIPNRILTNIASETSTQPVSSPKMTGQKNGILYFGVYKTDKTGIYAIGQIDAREPLAVLLSKRFATSDYSLHKPIALFIQGPNYYAAYEDNGSNVISRCESNNSPARSSNAILETCWIDFGNPVSNKQLIRAYLNSYPLPSGTSLDLYIATDYSSSETDYTQVKRANDTIFNSANGILGLFRPKSFMNKKAFKVKVLFTSNGTNTPKLQSIGLRVVIKPIE